MSHLDPINSPVRDRAGGRPPVILLGGGANALSVARSLGRHGVTVLELAQEESFSRYSRFSKPIGNPVPAGSESEAWTRTLLGPGSSSLHGSVLLACCDAALLLLCDRRAELERLYLLDPSNVTAQRQMIDKWETYRAASAAGVPTPKFWFARTGAELNAIRSQLVFPLVIKPKATHIFEACTGKKLLVANTLEELASGMELVASSGTEAMLVELIPGPDDRLCSYYTYLDADSRPLLHFTKRIIRRYPVMRGTGCYHITDQNPRAAELGNRLFAHVGLRGLANVEFKRDDRDGELKLIECNARFTAADCLVRRSGIDLARFVYQRIIGMPEPAPNQYATGMRLWDPIRDFCAYRALRGEQQLSFGRWVGSVLHRQSFPYFEWSDPLPAIARLTAPIRRRFAPWAASANVARPPKEPDVAPRCEGQAI